MFAALSSFMLATFPMSDVEAVTPLLNEILIGAVTPDVSLHCPNTPENRKKLIHEIASFYATFLLEETHKPENKKKLRANGMWLDLTPVPYYPSKEEICIFTESLESSLQEELMNKGGAYISMDYGPDSPALFHAFKKTDLPYRFFKLLPYKSLSSIKVYSNELHLNINLCGPTF